jgi:hypothetical protein
MSNLQPDGLAIRNIAVAADFAPWSDRAMQHAGNGGGRGSDFGHDSLRRVCSQPRYLG